MVLNFKAEVPSTKAASFWGGSWLGAALRLCLFCPHN